MSDDEDDDDQKIIHLGDENAEVWGEKEMRRREKKRKKREKFKKDLQKTID